MDDIFTDEGAKKDGSNEDKKKVGYTTSDLNRTIRTYLDDPHAQRAILINGEWGSGKTTRLKDWVRSNTHEAMLIRWFKGSYKPVVWVSAFGVASGKDLRLLIAKASLSRTLVGATANIVASSVNALLTYLNFTDTITKDRLQSWAKRPSVLIVDDVERVSGSINEVFGQINEFIEQYGIKVILVADLEKINDADKYLEKISDRIIRLPVDHDNMAALMVAGHKKKAKRFLFSSKKADKRINAFIPDILEAFKHSRTNNYRALSSAVESAYKTLDLAPATIPVNEPYLHALVYAVVAYTIEHRTQNLKDDDVDGIDESSGFFAKTGKVSSSLQKYTTYRISSRIGLPISTDFINWSVIEGFEKHDLIRGFLEANEYLTPRRIEDWEHIWHRFSTDEDIVAKAVASQQDNIDNLRYTNTGIVLHVFGNKMSLSEDKLIQDSQDNILTEAKSYIDKIIENNTVEFHEANLPHSMRYRDGSYQGLGYPKHIAEFKSFQDYLAMKRDEKTTEDASGYVRKQMELMDDFAECLSIIRSMRGEPYYEQFLQSVDPKTFAERVCSLPAIDRRSLGIALQNRVFEPHHKRELEEEWLERVNAHIVVTADRFDIFKNDSLRVLVRELLTERKAKE